MSLVDSIFGNSVVKDIAFKQLKKTMKENNLKAIIVKYDAEKDEFDFEFCEQAQTILPTIEFEQLKESFVKQISNED